MNGPYVLLACIGLIGAGFLLNRFMTGKLGWALVAVMFGSAIVALFVPKINGFDTFSVFYMSLFFGLGMNLDEKRKAAKKRREDWAKLKTERPQFKNCPHCTSKLAEREVDGKKRLACTYCQYVYWNNPLPVTATIVPHKSGGIVLVKRKVEPRKGSWCLPAGFMEVGETPEQGAQRESKEEATIDIEIERLIFTFAPPSLPQVLMFFVAKEIDQTPAPGDDAEEARVFALDELPEDMAFQSHVEAIKRWRQSVGR